MDITLQKNIHVCREMRYEVSVMNVIKNSLICLEENLIQFLLRISFLYRIVLWIIGVLASCGCVATYAEQLNPAPIS